MSERANGLGVRSRWALAGVLFLGLAIRFVGVVSQEVGSDNEFKMLQGIRGHPDVLPEARFYFQTLEALPFRSLGMSAELSGFLPTALAGIAMVVLGTLASRRLYGAEAGWIYASLSALSTIHCYFSITTHGVIDAMAFVALSLLLFTTRRRRYWALGGVCLGAGFFLRYHVGILPVTLAVAVLLCDGFETLRRRRIRALLTRLFDRAWVGCVSLATIVASQLLLARIYPRYEWTKLFRLDHENFSVPVVNGPFYWVHLLLRLDPLFVVAAVVAIAIGLSSWRTSDPRASSDGEPEAAPRFLSPPLVLCWAGCLVVFLCAFPSFSGMTRQVFPAMIVFHVALAGVLGRTASRSLRRFVFAPLAAAGVVVLVLATSDVYRTRGFLSRPPVVVQALEKRFPERAITGLGHEGDPEGGWDMFFVWKKGGYPTVREFARRPDVIVGGPRWFPFPYFEEEPYKLLQMKGLFLESGIAAFMDLDDIIFTSLLFVEPPLTAEDAERLWSDLPRRVRFATDIRSPLP